MNKNIISLKDFEITPNENAIDLSQNFQMEILWTRPKVVCQFILIENALSGRGEGSSFSNSFSKTETSVSYFGLKAMEQMVK